MITHALSGQRLKYLSIPLKEICEFLPAFFELIIGTPAKMRYTAYYTETDKKKETLLLRDYCKELTLADILAALNVCDPEVAMSCPDEVKMVRYFLEQLGAHYFHCKFLPLETGTAHLADVPKSEIRCAPFAILGVFGPSLRTKIEMAIGPDATVDELIKYGYFRNAAVLGCFGSAYVSFIETVRLLISLGFDYNDGPMFQFGTKRYFVQERMKGGNTTEAEARAQAEALIERRGNPFPLDEIYAEYAEHHRLAAGHA